MRQKFSYSAAIVLSALLCSILGASSALGQTTSFTYQGRLSDAGAPASGIYDIRFRLYDANGNAQGSPDTVTLDNPGVQVTSGVFTAQLDFGAGAFTGGTRLLEISVRPHSADPNSPAYTTLSPRQQITSTPYAIRSSTSATADSTSNFSGSLSGDVTGTQGATVVSSVGGQSASNVASGAVAANAAAAANTANAIVKRDASGNFSAGNITASLNGNAATATSVSGVVPIANGGTGSATKNFVDLSTNQANIVGNKAFTGNLGVGGPAAVNQPLTAYDTNGNAALRTYSNGIQIGDVDGSSFANYLDINFESTPYFKFIGAIVQTTGDVQIPAASNYKYATPKTLKSSLGPAAFASTTNAWSARIDDGFNSVSTTGTTSLWASGGIAGQRAYFVAPVQFPDGAVISGFSGLLIKNGGSLQALVELMRSDGTCYTGCSPDVIATATTVSSAGFVATVNAVTIAASFNTVDNSHYHYFVRFSGEQNTQNVRLNMVTVTYQVSKVD
jgi:hypothetical protein